MELLYGRHAVLEALRAGRRRIQRVYLGQGVQQTGIVAEILATARQLSCPVTPAPRPVLDRVGPVNHQGVVAEAEAYPYLELDDLLPAVELGNALYLALDHLQDVQNLGTLLRTAEAMAVTGVLLPDRRSASITPAVVNSSAGAVEHLSIAEVGNLVQALERLKNAGAWVVGLDAGAGAMPLPQADLSGSIVLVVGAEGAGLTRLVREHCDWFLSIPMYGKVASLNAAVAGSVALVAVRRARGTQ
jgi:23S rRNA (guanosine2251-2'-O)-methyltransferase